MQRHTWGCLGLGAMLTLAAAGVAQAEITSDRAAALIRYPLVQVGPIFDDDDLLDTAIEMTNVSTAPVDVHCFYENANAHCTLDGSVCELGVPETCEQSGFFGVCLPGWNEIDFRLRLTPRQPLGWTASEGLADFPIDGVLRLGSDGSSNAGSRVPPVPEEPFRGSLTCFAVDGNGNPSDRNVLKGTAAVRQADPNLSAMQIQEFQALDVHKYNAVGHEAYEGGVDDDGTLRLGRQEDGGEYQGCPNVTIVNHFFDGVQHPVIGQEVGTRLVMVPCSADFLRQRPGGAIVQFLVYNEFEQRFSTSRGIQCFEDIPLSRIDTVQADRSIFSAAVSGTTVGQTRARTIGDGMIAIAVQGVENNARREVLIQLKRTSVNAHFQGDREGTDEIIVP